MIHQAIRPRAGMKEISVEALLNWAFGTEWVVFQRGAVVGTKKGRRNQPHEMRRSA